MFGNWFGAPIINHLWSSGFVIKNNWLSRNDVSFDNNEKGFLSFVVYTLMYTQVLYMVYASTSRAFGAVYSDVYLVGASECWPASAHGLVLAFLK